MGLMVYRLLFSHTSREQVRSLHPKRKSLVKAHIQKLKENPFQGKPLQRELSGVYSLRTKRWRVIYRVGSEKGVVEIHYVGHRKDIYELIKDHLRAE